MLVFVHKPFTLFQVIAVDADPRNLAYLRASLDLNNSTNNVRILYNAVRLESNTAGQYTTSYKQLLMLDYLTHTISKS